LKKKKKRKKKRKESEPMGVWQLMVKALLSR
jgi:hypothetical protein